MKMNKQLEERFNGLTANIPAIVKERLLELIEDIEDEAFGRGYEEGQQDADER